MASHGEQTLPLTKDTATVKECQLGAGIGVGDCQQKAGSKVALQLSEILPGTAQAVWQATTLTTHSGHHGFLGGSDTWNQTCLFQTSAGKTVVQVDFKGDDMQNDNQEYQFLRVTTVAFDTKLWDQIKQVEWHYSC